MESSSLYKISNGRERVVSCVCGGDKCVTRYNMQKTKNHASSRECVIELRAIESGKQRSGRYPGSSQYIYALFVHLQQEKLKVDFHFAS